MRKTAHGKKKRRLKGGIPDKREKGEGKWGQGSFWVFHIPRGKVRREKKRKKLDSKK